VRLLRGTSGRLLGPSFERLWLGSVFASSGDGLALGAVPLLAVAVDPRPFAVSLVVAADSLPWLLMALPAGEFADRFERGPLIALMNCLRAAVILVAVLLILTDQMTIALLIVIALANSAGRAVYYSSMQAMAVALVDPDTLERANGVLSGTEAATEHLAGPVVGTSLFALSQSAPFIGESIALMLSCFPFARFHLKTAPQTTAESSRSMWDGIKHLIADRRLRVLLFMVASLAGLQGMVTGVLVLLATTEWGIRPALYGVFLAAGAVGNLLGSVTAARLVKRFGSAPTLIGTAVISGVGYLLMAAAHTWLTAGPAFILMGVAVAAGSVVAISLRQRLTPTDLMGRVGSAWRGIVWGALPVGAVLAGSLAAIGGLRLPLVLAGALQCAVGIVFARPLLRSVQGDSGSSVRRGPVHRRARHARRS
jgi:MFS family permease